MNGSEHTRAAADDAMAPIGNPARLSSDLRPALIGRQSEREMLDRLVAGVRAGRSQVLALRGEAGVGKSALLDHLADGATGCRVARTMGVDAEMELAYAGLHQLCAPMLDHLDSLPAPQRDALATAFGLTSGDPPARFLVGLAVLSLLADVAEEDPLLCIVDDMQWLDEVSAQTLAFVARRLLAEPIGLVFAVRDRSADLDGFPEVEVRGLSDREARELLDSVLTGPVDERVRDRIIAEARGNPLALLELPHASPAEVVFGKGWTDERPLASRLEQGYLERLRPLPADTRRLLLAAAVEPLGDASLLWRAADRLGIHSRAGGPAEAAGLVEFGTRVRFRHPLVRSAVYRAADAGELREVNQALAEATDPETAPEQRAWHRANAAIGPDEQVADELERSADRAQARGGLAAAGAFLERATALTPDAGLRAARALAAAQAMHQSGAHDAALELLTLAEAGPLDALQRARVELLRAQAAFFSGQGRDAPRLLLAAARTLAPLDAGLAHDTYLDAMAVSLLAGHLAREAGSVEVAMAAQAARPSGDRPADLLLDGFALLLTQGFDEGVPLLRRAVRAFRTQEIPPADAIRWLWLATHAAHDIWDDMSWDTLSDRSMQLTREAGALAALPTALTIRLRYLIFAGELRMSASLVDELAALSAATGSDLLPYGALLVAAWLGQEDTVTELVQAGLDRATSRGEGTGLALMRYGEAVLANGLGRYARALVAAERGAAYPSELGFAAWSLVELVEAAAGIGDAERAADALQRLAATTRPSGTHWALGVEARSRALVTGEEQAFIDAIAHLGRTQMQTELARAHLVYGEWLRREGRGVDAREQLRTAHDMFTTMEAEAFAERARRELQATGETVRKRTVDGRDALTPQERQIARLAAGGRTNPQIGAELFISPRTVEWHLHKVFAKLQVGSRRELRRALGME